MTIKEIQQRNTKAQHLQVIKTDEHNYYVDSSEGKIAYKVVSDNGNSSCSCGDFSTNIKRDLSFKCKHILAVQNSNGNALVANKYNKGHKPKLDERFLTNIQGKDFVLYAGLLDLAHQKGLHKVCVEAVQFPTKENGMEAICKAVVESKGREVFVEWGDSSPNNTNRKIAAHLLRMAATRAKARALRDFTNIGITCLEELGDLEDIASEQPLNRKPKKKAVNPEPQHQKDNQPESPPTDEKQHPIPRPSEAQLRAIDNLARRRNINSEELEEMAQLNYGTSFNNITSEEASGFIYMLQQS